MEKPFLSDEDYANRCGGCGLIVAPMDLLKRLYLASLGMVESKSDIPSHNDVESTFVHVMNETKALLDSAGETVPEIAKF